MSISGIYKIQSKCKLERIYIGSAINISERWRLHLVHLRSNSHHSKKLQNHYNKYGESDLQFSILICCDKEELIESEQFFIDALKPWFNICQNAGSPLGIKHSEEAIKHFSESHIGKPSGNKGNKYSDELRKKLSDSHKGQISWMKGRHHTEESRKKMSENNGMRGKIPWNKGISKELNPLTGIKRDPEIFKKMVETKRKIKEGRKLRVA